MGCLGAKTKLFIAVQHKIGVIVLREAFAREDISGISRDAETYKRSVS